MRNTSHQTKPPTYKFGSRSLAFGTGYQQTYSVGMNSILSIIGLYKKHIAKSVQDQVLCFSLLDAEELVMHALRAIDYSIPTA